MKKSMRKNDENQPLNYVRGISKVSETKKREETVTLANWHPKLKLKESSMAKPIKITRPAKEECFLLPEKELTLNLMRKSTSMRPTPRKNIQHTRDSKSPNKYRKNAFSDESPNRNPFKLSKLQKTDLSTSFVEFSNHCVVNGYHLKEEIGRGSYATVYRAEYAETRTEVAIKIYKKCLLTSTRENSIKHEISVLLKIDHPNIVKFIDCFTTEHHIFLVTELIVGKNLYFSFKKKFVDIGLDFQDRSARKKFVNSIMKQLISALFYLHSRRINHRDIKLDNIVFDHLTKSVKLLDFGFSKIIDPNFPEKLFCGTPTYMSPEAVLHKDSITLQSDVWALGVVYYALLFNQFPFVGKTDKELYLNIIGQPLKVPSWLSDKEIDFLAGVLNKDWKERLSIFQISKIFGK